MPPPRANIFVVGYDDYLGGLLERLPERERYAFHALIDSDELRGVETPDVAALLERARRRLEAFAGDVAGVVSFLDFPAVEITAVLNARFGLRGPSLEAVLRCNHKYWSRRLQSEAVPECVPRFALVDPFDARAPARLGLDYPFWVKPLNAYRSHLAFRIARPEDFRQAMTAMRAGIGRLARPFAHFLGLAALPDDIAALRPDMAIAEAAIAGDQCTLEGYVHGGEPEIYGVVDSIREPNRSSFARYQYPSRLPRSVQRRMADAAARVVRHLGLDDSAFNVEFYYERRRDRIWLLEINPRISQSHCDLFEKVDGVSHQQVVLDLTLGRRPAMPRRQGRFRVAGKFFLRGYGDARITRVPTRANIRRIEREVPAATVRVLVDAGTDLRTLHDQDAYSCELAWIWLGADNQRELLDKHRRVLELLDLEVRNEGDRRVV